MQIKDILDYQELDIKIRKIRDLVKNSEERQTALKMKKLVDDDEGKIQQLNDDAGDLLAKLKDATYNYNELAKKLELLLKDGTGETPEEVTKRIEKANSFLKAFATLEKYIEALKSNVDKKVSNYSVIEEHLHQAQKSLNDNKIKYNALMSKYEPELKKLIVMQDKIKEKIDPAVLEKYQRKATKLPVLVPCMDNRCGRCKVEISAAKLKELKEKGIIECESENCARYIYLA